MSDNPVGAAIRGNEGVEPTKAVLLVVDVQCGFRNAHSEHVVPKVVQLVDAWSAAGLPVVFARFFNAPGSPYETISGWTRLRTPDEQALVQELVPYSTLAAAVIDKSTSSALTADLAQMARDRGWTDLLICGIDTDACVYDTAVAAYHGGLRPYIVTDACASSGGPTLHEAALLMAERNIGHGQLLTLADVLQMVATEPIGGTPA